MIKPNRGMITSLAVLAMFGSGCGGEDSSPGPVATATPTPAPTPSPTPTPTPTPTPVSVSPITSSPLIPPFFSVEPQPLYADAGGAGFAATGTSASMPLLLSMFDLRFGGDKENTEGGGRLGLDASGNVSLSFGSSILGVKNIPLRLSPPFHQIGFEGTYPPSFLGIRSLGSTTYARSFAWIYGDINDDYGGGAGLGGFLTRPEKLPTAGSVSYSGTIGGQVSQTQILNGGLAASMDGSAALVADFSTRTITGQVSVLRVAFDNYGRPDPVNPMTFTATYDPTLNRYVGEVVAGPSPVGANAFQQGARGAIVLQAFGPNAEELGGVVVIAGTSARAVYTVLAKR